MFTDEDEKVFAEQKGEEIHCVEVDETNALLAERNLTHGSFEQNALISQRLKEQIRRHCHGYNDLPDVCKESIDMICLKLSRILSGQHNFKDHWDDIAGYAKLAADRCK